MIAIPDWWLSNSYVPLNIFMMWCKSDSTKNVKTHICNNSHTISLSWCPEMPLTSYSVNVLDDICHFNDNLFSSYFSILASTEWRHNIPLCSSNYCWFIVGFGKFSHLEIIEIENNFPFVIWTYRQCFSKFSYKLKFASVKLNEFILWICLVVSSVIDTTSGLEHDL